MRKPMPLVEKILAVLIALVMIVSPFAAHAVESAAQEEQDAPVCVPILMYHEVKLNKSGKDAIQPWELENDLKWLEQNGYTTVTMADLFAYVDDGTPLPEKPVVLSFDDGYYNNYVYALPLLRQYGAKIVLSVLGKNTDDFSEYPSENIDYAHMTWEQLAELRDSGLVEIQNHTYDLHAHTKQRIGCTQSAGESDAAYETLLYSPELKFYSNRIKMDSDLNTNIRGLHCLGDSSGWTRGLMMASAMGVLMGRRLAEKE